jgi:DNA-binding CsgD family transcriptional regulator
VSPRAAPLEPLTPIEQTVAALVGQGLFPPDICARLRIRRSTFRMHVRNLARKLPGDIAPLVRINLWWRGIDRVYLYRESPPAK